MLKPCGYYVLVKMEELEEKDESFVEGSELIVAAPQMQKDNRDLAEREKAGHDIGTLVALGSTAFNGFQGVTGQTAKERAEEWGVCVGDKVEFNRYDGKIPSHPDYADYRIIQDAHIIGVIED